jgi:hypothetical protein
VKPVLAIKQCGVEIVETFAVTFLLLESDLTAVVSETDSVANDTQVYCVLDLL